MVALGPFYHLPDPPDRDRAAGELARVLLACEGIVADLQEALAELIANDPAMVEKVLDRVFATAADPSILGMSAHLLYVGTRAG